MCSFRIHLSQQVFVAHVSKLWANLLLYHKVNFYFFLHIHNIVTSIQTALIMHMWFFLSFVVLQHQYILTHWGRVTHIQYVSNLTIIGSDNGLSPVRRLAIIWINAGILLIGLLGTNFSEILIEIHIFSFKKMQLKMSSAKWRPFCLGLNELRNVGCNYQSKRLISAFGSP